MGRSVNYLSNAVGVTYIDVSKYGYVEQVVCPECGTIDNFSEEGDFCEKCENVALITECVYDELESQLDYENTIEYIKDTIKNDTDLYEVNEWEGNEVHIILSNSEINVATSEYCGLMSISVNYNVNEYDFECDKNEDFDEEFKKFKKNVEEQAEKIANLIEEKFSE